MTLDEAIKHCLEVAEQKDAESLIDRWNDGDEWSESIKEDCKQCAAEHRQLAEWLTELKDLREENKVLMQECDRLIKEKGELLSKVSGGDTLRICQLEDLAKKSRDLIYKAKWSDYTDNMNADALYEQLCSTVGRI